MVIPEELIEYRREQSIMGQNENFVSRLLTRKRKKIYITSDSVCDLPEEYKEEIIRQVKMKCKQNVVGM